ncbi:MAG TPA: GntR family transcriptional regulator [Candidatus Aquilonibacter sp.]|nr:GntR family transcriptional regulator [Candidatus Aquilonibacter sp.]
MNVSLLFVDDASALPVYAQLQQQFMSAIGRGELRRGEQLPSVRDVAASLGINPNTVNRAYAELERDGMVATKRGRGTFVAGTRNASDVRKLVEIADRFVAHARSLGYEGSQIVSSVRDAVGRAKQQGSRR